MLAVWFVVVFVACSSDESLTPAESLAKIQLPAGLTVELAAHEPNVESPVAISFDERGRMFVVEYRDYPTGPKKGEPPLSRIRLLEDKDGDGFFETATVFADRLNFAQGVLAIQGGVIVTAAPDILFLKDTNGDNVADEKRILFTGFKAGNPQLRVSHPKLGMDNLVYVSNGLSGGEIRHVAAKGPVVPLAKDDFRFDPKTMIGEATTGFGQFGNTFDDWGRRFTCSNRNPRHSLVPAEASPQPQRSNSHSDWVRRRGAVRCRVARLSDRPHFNHGRQPRRHPHRRLRRSHLPRRSLPATSRRCLRLRADGVSGNAFQTRSQRRGLLGRARRERPRISSIYRHLVPAS